MKIITKTSIFIFTICFCTIKANAQLASDQVQPIVKTAVIQKSVMTAPNSAKLASVAIVDTSITKINSTKNIKATTDKAQQMISAQGVQPAAKPKIEKVILPAISLQTKE